MINQKEVLPCPTSPQGILELMKVILTQEVTSATITPGTSIEVAWNKYTADQELTGIRSADLTEILGNLTLTEFTANSSSARENFTDALLNLSFRGLVANNIVVSSLDEFKQAMNIPDAVPIPRYGPEQVPVISGMKILEAGEELLSGSRYVLLAAPYRTDDVTLSTFGLSVVY